ncbi:MAG: D-alanyl-D-alanine carboxypeptidase (penicillin-binding protein 5/6) [Akkermansiaceae bacterium]|jgi:D-alanyl-D-alanine carboxypeptidase (penicillin-binding protein 5/6)
MTLMFRTPRFLKKCTLLVAIGFGILSLVVQGGESYIAAEAFSGKILLELDADQKRPVASLTKIATAMVVLDWAELSKTSMAEMAMVPTTVASLGGSNPMGLIPGDRISLREAMYSMLLGSDNVSAYTLADHAGRSIQTRSGGSSPVGAFVTEMNILVRGLGMPSTHFANPHGMDTAKQRGVSTARDMARLGIYAMRNTGFQFYVKQSQRIIASYRGSQKRAFKVRNTHFLIGKDDVNGIKSGNTVLAGPCAATSSEKKPIVQKLENGATRLTGRRLIIITLDSPDRWRMTQTLINQGWAAYEGWRQQGSPVSQARELLSVPAPK